MEIEHKFTFTPRYGTAWEVTGLGDNGDIIAAKRFQVEYLERYNAPKPQALLMLRAGMAIVSSGQNCGPVAIEDQGDLEWSVSIN